MVLSFVSHKEISRIRSSVKDALILSWISADLFRLNALSMIMEAGSGHVGTSFSCMDILVWLWTQEMKNPNEQDGDIFFSSKGHDAPALYSLLIGLGKLPESNLHQLRRLGGLPGHPDVHTPYMLTNTGSLGMGVSKARGMALANRLNGKKRKIFVLTGDGELQEGQFWESLQPTANGKFGEITVIVDHNKIQSDTWVEKTSDLGNLEEKFKSFGWYVARCDGHDFFSLKKVFEEFEEIQYQPKILIADTIKGKGSKVFEEGVDQDELYKFHSGAPSPEIYQQALDELIQKINKNLEAAGIAKLELSESEQTHRQQPQNPEKLIAAYSDELVKIGKKNPDVVVLDADLKLDCGLIAFEKQFPQRFIECGIAEQDMVSMAGGLALSGKIPIVHSFACFLSTRPNEQIYNNATEETKIIYVGSLSGLLPATPGHSHQSVRDISALGSIPGLTMIEPANEFETRLAIRWAVDENPKSSYLRLVSIPRELPYKLPEDYKLTLGRGVKIVDGNDTAIFAYGPVMLTEAFGAAQILSGQGIGASVYNLPWLNQIDETWLSKEIQDYKTIFTIDDHYLKLGLGEQIKAALAASGKSVVNLGIKEIPACGQPQEVLEHHGLDADSLARKMKERLVSKIS